MLSANSHSRRRISERVSVAVLYFLYFGRCGANAADKFGVSAALYAAGPPSTLKLLTRLGVICRARIAAEIIFASTADEFVRELAFPFHS